MTPEERSLLERTHEMTEENNKILRSLRRSRRISLILSISYWVLIIGLSVGAFYFIQPYIDFIAGGTDSGSKITEQFKDLLK